MTTEFELQSAGSAQVDPYAETVRLRVLPESALQQPACVDAPERGFDPYSTGLEASSAAPKRRRTLDDMRRLSEAIVRKRVSAKQ
jgi:hypothetical protein